MAHVCVDRGWRGGEAPTGTKGTSASGTVIDLDAVDVVGTLN